MFSIIKVHVGDYVGGTYTPLDYCKGFGTLRLYTEDPKNFSAKVTQEMIHSIEVATQESAIRLGGTDFWRVDDSVILGPYGLLKDLILSERGTEITFILVLNDGKKILATTDRKAYMEIARTVSQEVF